ncbi:uncharacterized protein TRIADDRAFT_61334 [Trichoplax adhaerens]|uniref:Methyltransferase domain-containing protein n=1 Tax=Trichoplax adhaerens TaxID=10228 RepID=B3SAP7_TRIAD|nr:predicted protein [Trichoplax adhaerens]EDV20139.1 predicted protein [Trichoplax adhaerens]|eukprot:XP_002117300.1 predicted protein [Trichoplax adhaerens]
MEGQTIRTDIFEYDKAFLGYKSRNNDHQLLSLLNHSFLKELESDGLFRREDQPTIVGDIGCGDADAIIRYLQNVEFKGGLDIRAIDKHPVFAGIDQSTDEKGNSKKEKGLAEENFSKVEQAQTIPLKSFQVKYGDILQDDVVQLLLRDEEMKTSMNRFNLVFMSHAVYYARGQHKNGRYGVTNLVDSVASNLLSDDGVAILFHTSLSPVPHSYLARAYYTRGVIENETPTEEEYKSLSVDYIIRSSCNELGLTYFEIPYTFKLFQSKEYKKYSDIYKDPSRYHELQGNAIALQGLYATIFIGHRSPDNMHADQSPRGLNHVVDKVIDAIDNNDGFEVVSCMQIILSRKASDEFKQKIEKAVKICQNKLCDS